MKNIFLISIHPTIHLLQSACKSANISIFITQSKEMFTSSYVNGEKVESDEIWRGVIGHLYDRGGEEGGGESVPIYSFHCLISDGTILIGSNIKGNNLTMDPARQVLTFFFAIANLLNILYCPTFLLFVPHVKRAFLLFVHHFKRAEVGIDQRKRFKDLYFFLVETCCFYSFFFCISILPT